MTPFDLVPGAWVRLPNQADWGQGQVQSCIGGTVTVNFEHAGKRVLKLETSEIEVVYQVT